MEATAVGPHADERNLGLIEWAYCENALNLLSILIRIHMVKKVFFL